MNTENGWIKFYREWLDNPIIMKDAEHLAVWGYLVCNAVHNEMECIFKNEKIKLSAGQMLVKQCDIADKLKIDRFKVMRILKLFENAHLITHSTDKRKTLITLEHWAVYQGLNTRANALSLHVQCTSEKETENEKEKRSKREKDKEKEINKNERMKEIYNPPYIPPLGENDEEKFSLNHANACISSMQGIAYHHPKGVYHQPLGCINGETEREDFPLTEKDLDKWLEEDDGIDDWDKFQIFYKKLNSGQMSVVGGQQDCYTEYGEVNGLDNTNPIQQENKEYNKLPPKPPSCDPVAITQNACMESAQGVVWNQSQTVCNQPSGCMSVNEANISTLFDEFWQAYPKKVGKGYAFECFKKTKPTRKLVDTMLEAIKKQKKSDMWKRDKGQYIPNPSTWLNQKRWEDDLGGDTDENPWSSFKLGIEL